MIEDDARLSYRRYQVFDLPRPGAGRDTGADWVAYRAWRAAGTAHYTNWLEDVYSGLQINGVLHSEVSTRVYVVKAEIYVRGKLAYSWTGRLE